MDARQGVGVTARTFALSLVADVLPARSKHTSCRIEETCARDPSPSLLPEGFSNKERCRAFGSNAIKLGGV